ncbi:MAG: hypothetical protein VX853_01675, partial [Pseudomonadota bacterium]|nr:hypothetical protein [Pseudomonadota bacterium]
MREKKQGKGEGGGRGESNRKEEQGEQGDEEDKYGQQERERLWRCLVVGCALLLVPGVYLLDNVSVIVDLYVGTIIRATVPMLYNGTMTLVVFGLAVGWLGHLISRR